MGKPQKKYDPNQDQDQDQKQDQLQAQANLPRNSGALPIDCGRVANLGLHPKAIQRLIADTLN